MTTISEHIHTLANNNDNFRESYQHMAQRYGGSEMEIDKALAWADRVDHMWECLNSPD